MAAKEYRGLAYRNETRTRTYTTWRCIPETREVSENYTVMVPQQRTREETFTVRVPVIHRRTSLKSMRRGKKAGFRDERRSANRAPIEWL